MPLKRILSLAIVTVAVLSSSVLAAESKDAWQNELLLQLSELRKEQGELKHEVADLRAEVTRLRSGAGSGSRPGTASLDLTNPSMPSLGDSKAQLAIVEFSDFQCPYCRRHEQSTMPALKEKYVDTGQARYFFVDFPLGFHNNAHGAAIAGACAQRQDAFWKMHDKLFENQSQLGQPLYLKLADEIGLDKAKFQACLADPKVKAAIDANIELGDRVGVQGTPAFFIGRIKDGVLIDARMVSGARPLQDFEKALQSFTPGS